MSLKKTIGLTALGLVLLAVIAGITVLILIRVRPGWYRPERLSQEQLLAAKEDMIHIVAEFKNESQKDAPFILELTDKQINDRLALLVDRYRILPSHIADPFVHLGHGAVWAGARVTWKGQQSFLHIRLRARIDSAGLLHLDLDKLRAGALGLPDTFVTDTLDSLEKNLLARLAAHSRDPAEAQADANTEQIVRAVFTALSGVPVETYFGTRKDLQMVVEDIRIKPGLLEIQFRPLPLTQ